METQTEVLWHQCPWVENYLPFFSSTLLDSSPISPQASIIHKIKHIVYSLNQPTRNHELLLYTRLSTHSSVLAWRIPGTGKRQAENVGRGPLNSQRHLELVVNSLGRDQGSSVNSSIKLSAQCSMRSNGQNTAFNLDTEDYLSTRSEIPKISCT